MSTGQSPAPEPHRARGIAESFGVDPERYDRARPPYPQAVIGRVLAAAPGRAVLDVGTGTGIVARQFRAAGCTVLGVEPDARMAGFARGTGIDVEVATFETWDAGGRAFDAVVAGTAWHWVDPVAGAATAARILRPGGVLGPFGSVYELPPAVAQALAEALRRVAPDSPVGRSAPGGSMLDAYGGLYERAADGVRRAGGFGEPELWRHDLERAYAPDDLVELVATSGGLTALPPDRTAQVLEPVAEAVAALGDRVTLRYATWGLTAVRDGAP